MLKHVCKNIIGCKTIFHAYSFLNAKWLTYIYLAAVRSVPLSVHPETDRPRVLASRRVDIFIGRWADI